MASFLLTKDSGLSTFFYDDQLPNLPLPPLEATLEKYLESVKPFVTPEELENTRKIVEDFKNGAGKALQEKLAEKAANSRNWLEKWWFEQAYLKNRMPMVPFTSFTGMFPKGHGGWTCDGIQDQINNASYHIYLMVQFWDILRKELLPPVLTSEKKIFDMSQFRRQFSAVRLPGKDVDSIVNYFKTEKEGDTPTHIVVIHRGHYFKLDILDENGEIIAPPVIARKLAAILARSEEPLTPIATLTATNRTRWWKNRETFKNLSDKNAKFLDTVESAISHFALDDLAVDTDDEGSTRNYRCDVGDRWVDKSFVVVGYRNGRVGGISEHSQYDGMTSFTLNMYFLGYAPHCYKQWRDKMPCVNETDAECIAIPFDVNEEIEKEVQLAIAESKQNADTMVHNFRQFTRFGKAAITKAKFHPDTFLQMSLQLAYMKLHGKPAPCYETATTRQFYHGRTETLRSCTVECVQWVKSMLDPEAKSSEKYQKLLVAVDRHNQLMKEGCNNHGCDRHLLGLQCIAEEEGLPLHELYTDPAYIKSGGGGNYVLSTSLAGYSVMTAVVAPMTTDGYGAFYAPNPDKIVFGISAYRHSSEASTEEFYRCIEEGLIEMMEVISDQQPVVNGVS